ncbi:hypothetical protein [Bradyrhizobium liaoningense]
MDAKDIWLLVAGTILGFVTNILSTFAIPTVGSAFGKLKSGFIERNKARALANYCLVSDLKTGKRDKYLYALNHWGHICLMTFLALGSGFAGVMTGLFARPLLRDGNETLAHNGRDALSMRVIAFLLAILVLVMIARILWRSIHLDLTLSRVEQFDHYRAELMRQFPDIKLPD